MNILRICRTISSDCRFSGYPWTILWMLKSTKAEPEVLQRKPMSTRLRVTVICSAPCLLIPPTTMEGYGVQIPGYKPAVHVDDASVGQKDGSRYRKCSDSKQGSPRSPCFQRFSTNIAVSPLIPGWLQPSSKVVAEQCTKAFAVHASPILATIGSTLQCTTW
jgi:hypothetical protein